MFPKPTPYYTYQSVSDSKTVSDYYPFLCFSACQHIGRSHEYKELKQSFLYFLVVFVNGNLPEFVALVSNA